MSASESKHQTPKRYVFHLDAAPASRWTQIVADHKNHMRHALAYMRALQIPCMAVVSALASTAARCGVVQHAQELRGIAQASGVSLGSIVLLQFAYEAAAQCTSIVTPNADGKPVHGRTMDWEAPFLRHMTIELDCRRNNKTVFLCTTWVGYVGVLTGMRPDAYSVSINFREQNDGIWRNIKGLLSGHVPIGFLVRQVLDDCATFDDAMAQFTSAKLVAPCYIIVAGASAGQGAVLARSRDAVYHALELFDDDDDDAKKKEENKYPHRKLDKLIQTNIDYVRRTDPPRDILSSRHRYAEAQRMLQRRCALDMWEILQRRPIHNSITLYSCIMCPASGVYETRVYLQ